MAPRVFRDLYGIWSLAGEQQTLISTTAKWLGSVCRVGPGNFTPSPSQIRT